MMDRIAKIEIPGELSARPSFHNTIGICEDLPAERLIEIAAQYGLWHIVQTKTPHFQNELAASELMIAELEKFIEFPVSAILNPAVAGVDAEMNLQMFSVPFSRASEKNMTLAEVEKALQTLRVPPSVGDEIVMVADEMFTNATYNAPHVSFAKNGPGVERNSANGELKLRPARLFLGRDGSRIVLGCEDQYGTLNPRCLVQRLQTCYSQGPSAAINWAIGGAGLGTYMIFRSALSFYAGVQNGKRTVVACTFPGRRGSFQPAQGIHLSSDSTEGADNGT